MIHLKTSLKALLLLVFLIPLAQAEEDTIGITFDPWILVGQCNYTDNPSGEEFFICVGEFFNPSISHAFTILFSPFTTLESDIVSNNPTSTAEEMGVFSVFNLGEILSDVINFPLDLLKIVVKIIVSIILFVLIVGFRFVFVYLFYVSLGFQSLLMYTNMSDGHLQSVQKIQITLAVIFVATVVTMSYGGGWIVWS